tara:strand:+ start:24179 stop:24526 length:348 start_codon:yes stop_codon:yes gene_type:complete
MKDDTSNRDNLRLTETFSSSAKRIVTLDLEKYQGHLDGLDVSDERKEEFLRAMFSIVMTFVDLGFEVHPLQEVCGKNEIGTNRRTQRANDAVRSEKSQQSLSKPKTGPSGCLENK